MAHRTSAGGRLQTGIPHGGIPGQKMAYLVRGVVVATYVSDDPLNPNGAAGDTNVYCDILVYTFLPGGRFYLLPQVMVTPDVAGLQNGTIYRPRAAKNYLDGTPFKASTNPNPAQLDGDHVLVGFIDGDRNNPVVVRFLPHPSKDAGNSAALAVGQRQTLKLADGDPCFYKHHGSYFGISASGDFTVDTSLANDGTLLPGGAEPVAGATGTGHIIHTVGGTATLRRSVVNAATPGSPIETLRETLAAAGYTLDAKALDVVWQLLNAAGNALHVQHSGSSTLVTMGDGARSVAIAEQLQSWWNGTVVPYIQQMIFQTQLGPTAPGPTVAPPSFDATIISGKIKIPGN